MPAAAEERAFLQTILANYRDDGPRLLYADFLDESSDPDDHLRAEFLRLQLALAKISEDHPRRRELTSLQNDILLRNHARWTRHLYGLASGFQFRRGLLEVVSVDVATFAAHAEELFNKAPIRRVKFLDAGQHIQKLAHCPDLARIRELDLCGNDLANGGLNILLRSHYLDRVEALDLSHNGLGNSAAKIVAEAITLPRLRALWLNGNSAISDDGVKALAESPFRIDLRRLDLSGNSLGEASMLWLTGSEHLRKLHSLRVNENRIGDAGVVLLAGSELLERMLAFESRLDLRQNQIGPAGARALAGSPRVQSVTSLILSGNSLGDEGMQAIAESPYLSKLQQLVVPQNLIGNVGAVRLAISPLMERLRFIDVSSNRMTQDGIDALFQKRKDGETVIEYAGNFIGASSSNAGPSWYRQG